MSIIHDALKKIQQESASKADETRSGPPITGPNAPGYLYANTSPVENLPKAGQTTGQKPSVPNKIKTILALLCAIAITVGAFGFLYKQMNTYFPQVKRFLVSSFYKSIHKPEPDSKANVPETLPPLARITVKPTPPPPAISNIPPPPAPQTLNVHGVMSNGPNNLVLINDQVYQEGDEVDGVKIVKINLDFITVIINGKEEQIRVKN